jgi:stress-induced morphogen
MAISEKTLEDIIRRHFPDALIKIQDIAGDQDHYSLEIVDASFENVSLINQHRMVKSALSEVLNKNLHAVTIKTKSPSNLP